MEKYAPLLLIFSYACKSLIITCSINDALIIFALSAIYCFGSYLQSKKEVPLNASLIEKIEELEKQVVKCTDTVNSIKLGNNLKR